MATAGATAEQGRYNSALRQTLTQLAALKGDARGSLEQAFPSATSGQISLLGTLRGRIDSIKTGLIEEAGAAKEAERAITAAGKEGAAAFRAQVASIHEAEVAYDKYAATVARTNAVAMKKLGAEAKADAKGSYGGITLKGAEKAADTGLMVGAGIAGVGGLALKEAADFDTAMRDMNASLRLPEPQFLKLRQAVLALTRDPEVLDGPKELAKAFYEPASVLGSTKQALEALHQGARLAASGMANVTDATHLMTTVMKTGISGVSSASEAADVLARAVHMGSIHVQQLAESFPQMAQMGKAAGISLQDLLAAYVGLSRRGIDAGHAQELLTQLLNRILKPAKQAQGIFDELGISWGRSGIKATGLTGIIQQLAEANRNHADTLDMAMGRIQSFQAVMALTDEDGKEYKDTLAGLTDKTRVVGAAHESIQQQVRGAGGQFKALSKDVQTLGVDVGDRLLPSLKNAVKGLDDLVNSFGKLSPGKQDAIVKGAEYSAFFLLISSGATKAIAAIAPLLKALGGLEAAPALIAAAALPATHPGQGPFDVPDWVGGSRKWVRNHVWAGMPRDIADDQYDARHAPPKPPPPPAAAPVPDGSYTTSQQVKDFLAKGGAPPGVHPEEHAKASKKLTEAQREMASALRETATLEAELTALHSGHAKSVGDLAAKYHLLPPPVRTHIQALRDQIKAFADHKAEVEKHAAALAREHEQYQKAVSEQLAKTKDFQAALTGHKSGIAELAEKYPHATAAQLKYLDGLAQGQKNLEEAHAALKKLSEATRELASSMNDIGERLPVHATALKFFGEELEKLPPHLQAVTGVLAGISAEGGSLRKFVESMQQAGQAIAATNDPFTAQRTAVQLLGKSFQELTASEQRWVAVQAQANRMVAEHNLLLQASAGFQKARAELAGDRLGALRADHPGIGDSALRAMEGADQLQKRAGAVAAAEQNGIQQPQFTNPFADEINRQYARAGELTKGATIGGRDLSPEEQMQAFQKQLSGPALAAFKKQFGDADAPDNTKAELEKLQQRFAKLNQDAETEKAQWMSQSRAFFDRLQTDFKQAADAFTKGAQDAFSGLKDGLAHSLNYLDEVIGQIGAAGAKALAGAGSSAIAGARAGGGDVYGGQMYLTGERGPELFVPSTSGTIIPNSALAGAGGGNVTVHMTVVTPDAHSFNRSRGQIMQDVHRSAEYHRSRNG